MRDVPFGRLVRLSRIRLGWRQVELAEKAGATRTAVSFVERGHLDAVLFGVVRTIAAELDLDIEVDVRSRAVNVDRVLNARHAAMAEFLVAWLSGFAGWIVRAEVTYSEYGERGSIDLLCWHAATRSLLVVEIKTELMEFGEVLAKLDEKGRLGWKIARRLGWDPDVVSTCLLVADSPTNRRRAGAHGALLRASLPDGPWALTRWLRKPSGAIHALRFVSDARPGRVRTDFAAPTRVRTRGSGRSSAGARSGHGVRGRSGPRCEPYGRAISG